MLSPAKRWLRNFTAPVKCSTASVTAIAARLRATFTRMIAGSDLDRVLLLSTYPDSRKVVPAIAGPAKGLTTPLLLAGNRGPVR
jgi:hypothetical protein